MNAPKWIALCCGIVGIACLGACIGTFVYYGGQTVPDAAAHTAWRMGELSALLILLSFFVWSTLIADRAMMRNGAMQAMRYLAIGCFGVAVGGFRGDPEAKAARVTLALIGIALLGAAALMAKGTIRRE